MKDQKNKGGPFEIKHDGNLNPNVLTLWRLNTYGFKTVNYVDKLK